MTNEERKDFYMNRNIKLFPLYCASTWDVLFVWTITTMFYTNVKGLTYSQAILLDSIQMIFACIMCIPLSKIFDKMKPVKASRIGNLGYIIFLTLVMVGSNFWVFAAAQFFLACAYIIGNIKTTAILNQSLSAVDRDKDYQRVYGKSVSIYYVLESVSAIISTYLFSWNPYASFCTALVVVVLAEIYSLLIKEPPKFQEKNAEINARLTYKERKARQPDSFVKLLSSAFIIILLIYSFLSRGALSMDTTQFRLYLQGLTDSGTMPIWLYGYIFAIMRLVMALSSRYQFKFDLKFGVKSLYIFIFTFLLSIIASACVYIFMPDSVLKIVVIVVLMIITCAIRSPNRIFVTNYMQVCTDKKNYERMYALNTIAEYSGYAVLNAVYAQILDGFADNFAYTNLLYAAILAVPLIVVLIFFSKVLTKKFAQKYTIIKPEYTED